MRFVMIEYRKPKILYAGDIKDPVAVERIIALKNRFDVEVCNGTESSFIEQFHIFDKKYSLTIFGTEESYIEFIKVSKYLNIPGLDIKERSGIALLVLDELNLDEESMKAIPKEQKHVFSRTAKGLSDVVGELCTKEATV